MDPLVKEVLLVLEVYRGQMELLARKGHLETAAVLDHKAQKVLKAILEDLDYPEFKEKEV